jgi:hypothetical protein
MRVHSHAHMQLGRGWLDWLSPAEEQSEDSSVLLEELCRESGWDVQCEIGAANARRLGGTGKLASGDATGADVGLDLRLRFLLDSGFEPPQGSVELLRPSRFFDEAPGAVRGFWKVDADDDAGVPTAVQWRLSCTGLNASGNILVSPGPLYFNAKVEQPVGGIAGRQGVGTTGVRMGDGRITVKEDLGVNLLFQARGILAEFKIVGSFECSPAKPQA